MDVDGCPMMLFDALIQVLLGCMDARDVAPQGSPFKASTTDNSVARSLDVRTSSSPIFA